MCPEIHGCGSCRQAQGSQVEGISTTGVRSKRYAGGVSFDDCTEIRWRTSGQSTDAYLCGSIHRQQGYQCQRWFEMDRNEWRLLQRVRQPTEGLNLLQLRAQSPRPTATRSVFVSSE